MNVEIVHYFSSSLHGKSNFINSGLSRKRRTLQVISSPYQTGSVMVSYLNGKRTNGIIWTPLTCSPGSPVAEEAMLETALLLRLSGNFNPGIWEETF